MIYESDNPTCFRGLNIDQVHGVQHINTESRAKLKPGVGLYSLEESKMYSLKSMNDLKVQAQEYIQLL